MITLRLDARNAKGLLSVLRKRADDFRLPLAKAASDIEDRIAETFVTATDPWGRAWDPLSRTTLRNRSGSQPLFDTGALFASISSRVTPKTMVIGSNSPYAEFHQNGNDQNRAWGGGLAPIPRRAFMPIDESGAADLPPDWVDEIMIPVTEFLMRGT